MRPERELAKMLKDRGYTVVSVKRGVHYDDDAEVVLPGGVRIHITEEEQGIRGYGYREESLRGKVYCGPYRNSASKVIRDIMGIESRRNRP